MAIDIFSLTLAQPNSNLKLTTFGEKFGENNKSARKTKMENALKARVFEIETSYLVECFIMTQ